MPKKNFLYNFIWIALFKLIIELVYIKYICVEYTTFSNDFNMKKNLSSWFLLIFSFYIINYINNAVISRISTLLLYIVYLLSYIPGISYWSLANLNNSFIVCFNIYWFYILLLMFFYSKIKITHKEIILNENLRKIIFYLILIFAILFGIYYSYRYSGFRIKLNLNDVYEIRAQAKASNASTLENLLYYIVSTLVYPLYAIIFFKDKRMIEFFITTFMQLLMFSVGGHKFYIFIIPVGIIGYYFYSDRFIKQIPKLSILLIVIGIIEYKILSKGYILSYFVRRVMYVPAQLDYYYFDFFTKNKPIYFAQDNFLSRLGVTSPYDGPVSQVIGDIYSSGANANTGLFGDAFANLGVYSILIFPIIFLIMMLLLDLITSKLSIKHYMTVLVSIIVVLLNGEISGIFYNFILPISIIFIFIDTSSNKKTRENIQI